MENLQGMVREQELFAALPRERCFFAFPIVALLALLRYIVVDISFFITLIKMPKQCLGD